MLDAPRRLLAGLARKIAPAPSTWRGATRGALLGVALLWAVEAVPKLVSGGDNPMVWLAVFLQTCAMALAGLLTSVLVGWIGRFPAGYRWMAVTALLFPFAIYLTSEVTLSAMGIVTAGAIVLTSVAAGAFVVWRRTRSVVPLACAAVSAVALLLGLRWLLAEGNDRYAAIGTTEAAPAIDRPDPSQPGTFAVKTVTYGSGSDRRRPEFGAAVPEAFRTASVDGSKLMEAWSGGSGWARTRYWGFDAEHMPLQARVWYPDGAGPFPLVLIVHGNHDMEEYSDPGYAYLGELLASRGFIVASVDENFLNSSASANMLGFPTIWIKKENDARAWLLLEHLRVWQTWNGREGHPLFGRVDMHRIALIGHSRGGEAVAEAAVFNRLSYYPDDAEVRFGYDFDIRTVVAIAPVDGQYKPGGRKIEPRNVNYLVLQGTEDGDLLSFLGARQLERVTFTNDDAYWCKASLYIRGANHGQFNTVWGRHDTYGFAGRFLNFDGIMPPEAQRQVAKTAISAFLEATLYDQAGYLALFRHPHGQAWLPKAVYRGQFTDSATRRLATYEEDIDLATTTVPGGSARGEHLSTWREQAMELSWGELDTSAVVLGWDAASKGAASYTLSLPADASMAKHGDLLVFSLADVSEDEGKHDEPIELTVELGARSGEIARRRVVLPHAIATNVVKAALARRTPTSELVFQSFELPIDMDDVSTIRFVFDKSASGSVALDDVGVRTPR